jgi:hypothetical protein
MASNGLDIAIRRLCAADAAALQALRLEALLAAPEAFSSSHDEEAARPREWFALIGHAAGCVVLLHATVTARNTAAQALYRQSGFVRFGTEPKALLVDGKFYDDDLLILDLSRRTP